EPVGVGQFDRGLDDPLHAQPSCHHPSVCRTLMCMAYTIEAEGLRKAFGETRVLEGLDLRIGAGDVFALLGPNGAGKTTTVRILSTLLAPDHGSARVAGHDVVSDRKAVRRAISLTAQEAAVDGLLTGAENLRMMARLRRVKG